MPSNNQTIHQHFFTQFYFINQHETYAVWWYYNLYAHQNMGFSKQDMVSIHRCQTGLKETPYFPKFQAAAIEYG